MRVQRRERAILGEAIPLAGAFMRGWAALKEATPTTGAAADDVEALVYSHAGLVYRVAYAVLRNPDDAEDATQETFLRVLRYRSRLPQVANRRAWLVRIAWRVAFDRRRPALDVSLDESAEVVRQLRVSGGSPEEVAGNRQMSTLVERCIASLPRKLRDPLILSTVEEMNSAEIGAVLRIPEATVRTRLMRARMLLREKLSMALEGKHGR